MMPKIFCYLDSYDEANFSELINNLYKNTPEDLYDIMLRYSSKILSPIKMDLEFFNKFISHSIKKNDFAIFKIGLTYIKDIETFIYVIENNKVDIYDIYSNIINENNMIKIDKDLKLKEFESKDKEKEGLTNEGLIEEKNNKISSDSMQNDGKIIPDYIDNLESIINTSIEKNKVFINLTNDFWKYILNCFHKVSTNNIKIMRN